MASHDLGRDLGELRGQLDALVPTLERIEGRVYQAEKDAAGAEARNQGLRKEFDELKTKISARLADLYAKVNHVTLENNNRKNEIDTLRREVGIAVDDRYGPLDLRLSQVETTQAAIKTRNEGWKIKLWKVVEIVLAAGIGALVTWFLK